MRPRAALQALGRRRGGSARPGRLWAGSGAGLSGERPASLRTVTGARWASRSAGTPARSPSPVGFARQPALGALDRNAVTGERIPVQPGCQQFIVQVGAVLGVRDATLTAEVLRPVLGFLPQVAEEAQVGPVSPLAGQAAVTERPAGQPAEPLIGQQRIIRRRIIRRLLSVTMMPSRYPGGAMDPSTAATASSTTRLRPVAADTTRRSWGPVVPPSKWLAPSHGGRAGGERQPHGRGLVICTVQAQDQAPVGSHLLASQVSETTRHSHLSPRHPATARRNRTTAKMSVIRDDQGCGGLARSTA